MDHCLYKVEGVAYLTNRKERRGNGPLPLLFEKERREGGYNLGLSKVEGVAHLAILKEEGRLTIN